MIGVAICVAAAVLAAAFAVAAVAGAAPYVSCPGGYIAKSLADCPPVPIHVPPNQGRGTGGPRGGGGLLGGLLGGLI